MIITTVHCLDTLNESSFVLRNNGLLITGKVETLDILKIIFNFLYIIVVQTLIVLNIKVAIRISDMALMNWMICILIPVSCYTAKVLTLVVHRKRLRSLMDDLNSCAFNEHTKELNRHVQKVKTMSNLILKYFGIAVATLVFVTCILPFVMDVKLMIPAPLDTGRLDVFYKLLHLVTITYFVTNAVCFDIFYLTLMGVAIAQLNILAERLIKVQENSKQIQAEECTHDALTTIVTRILRKCFMQHQVIIEFVNKLSVLGSFPLSVQYTCGCFIICNTIARLTIMGEADIANIISSISYSSVVLTEMAAYHWIANEIIYKSSKITESCYLSIWYGLSLDSQKSLLPLMERARRPLIIQLYGLIDISLASLGVVIRWSYSLFAVIRARYN